ncbi:orexigenic neuropeptide QRFP [Podarcis muralis]|nr:orexigenic neuropeptide QRFP [Podarcis muralis]XP_028571528.1 orexigenic neuropeptide QRFP [Podarcis muralis]XP_028571529.1 orexigenic neuropeptide QRFP [Podarcis muralis]
MKASCLFSCFSLLSFCVCFPLDEGQALGQKASLWVPGAAKWKCSPGDFKSLLSIARELQGFEKERAGIRLRFGRERGGDPEDENEATNYLPEEAGEKRAGTLGNLAEELNGYSRKKGGFSFRFGRRRRTAALF